MELQHGLRTTLVMRQIKASTEATAFVADNPHALFVINANAALPDNDLFAINMDFATATTGTND